MSRVEGIGGTRPGREGETRAPAAGGSRRLRPLGATAVTVYGTLLCLGLAIPSSVVSGLRDASPNALTDAALRIATSVETGLDATGLPAIYRAAKERFRQISCGAPDSGNPC